MRRTVNLDDDVEQLLRDEARRTGQSLTAVLNLAIRASLGGFEPPSWPLAIVARDLGLRPGFDPAGFNQLLDLLDAEAAEQPEG